MKYDLHIHSKYSPDGFLIPEKIVKIAKKKGLDGFAITDHNTIKGGIKAKEYETMDLRVIVGSEIKTERGEIIGLFLSKEIKSGDFEGVISEIKDQDGIVIIPHPFDELRHSAFHPTENDLKFIDAVEVFNSRCVSQRYNKKARNFAKENGLAITAGSDGHFANEIGKGGIITEEDDLKKAIIKNNIEVFGRRSSLVNHGFTKVLKLWRKIKSG